MSNKKGGILIDKGHHHVVVQGNWIGVTPSGVLGGNAIAGVQIQRGSFGMLVKQNVIAGNPVGVRISSTGSYPTGPEQRTFGNTISQNSTYSGTGIQFIWQSAATMVQDNIQPPTIVAGTGGTVSGTACANCTIEVFVAANKTGKMGKTYLTTVTANASGAWSAATGQPGQEADHGHGHRRLGQHVDLRGAGTHEGLAGTRPPPMSIDQVAALLADLIRIDSVNPGLVPGAAGERAIVDLLRRRLDGAGWRTVVVEARGAANRASSSPGRSSCPGTGRPSSSPATSTRSGSKGCRTLSTPSSTAPG
ncbi:MAG: hypothetical protein IPH03_14085 [Tetrasphaera sp.]|nr:hypothetical protein [Tetrasphaera sp.]